MARGGKRNQRPHRPHELGPRLFRRGRWWAIDMRPWDLGRPTVRNPSDLGWPDRGQRTEDRDIADRWRWAYVDYARDRQRRRALNLPPPPRKLEAAAGEYLRHREKHRAPNTVATDRTAITHLLEWFRRHQLTSTADLTPELMQAIVDARLQAGYAASSLSTLRGSWFKLFEWLGIDALGGVTFPDVPETDARAWTDDELGAICDAADYVARTASEDWPDARRMVELFLSAGVRQQEGYILGARAFDQAAAKVRITEQLDRAALTRRALKGKRARSALVLPEWWAWHDAGSIGLVLGRRDGRPLGYTSQKNLLARILDAARLNEVGVGHHRFRHTYARLFLQRGGSLDQLSKSLGHTSVRTTQAAYEHWSSEDAAELARRIIYAPEREADRQ